MPREWVLEIRDPTKPLQGKDAAMEKLSFEDAAYRDIVDEDAVMMGSGEKEQDRMEICFGGSTPKHTVNDEGWEMRRETAIE